MLSLQGDSRGCGGMVDATDLKSVDIYNREGSSPSTPNNNLLKYINYKGEYFQFFFLNPKWYFAKISQP